VVLPSKKIIPILLACIVAVGSIIFALTYQKKEPEIKKFDDIAVVSGAQSVKNQILDIDTDLDGLKDWEETLWGTLVENKDSDQDGTTDGAEVAQGRNPSVKGPNDRVSQNQVPKNLAQNKTETENISTTDIIARELFSNYMNLKQQGKEITPEMEAELAERLVVTSRLAQGTVKVYFKRDLKIGTNDSQDAKRAYGNAMGSIIVKNTPSVHENELLILDRAVQNQDKKEIAKLGIIQASYKKNIQDFLNLVVPPSVADIHLAVVNSFSLTENAVDGMTKVFTDPVVALSALEEYQNAGQEIATTFIAVELYFKNQNILFGQSEPGYMFSHLLQ